MYLTKEEVEQAIEPTGFSKDQYFEYHPEEKFDDLLEELERDSRAIIDNQLKGEGLEEEKDKVEEKVAPSSSRIQLSYPVNNVSKVERIVGGESYELDEERYNVDKYGIVLRGGVRDLGVTSYNNAKLRMGRNPLKRFSNGVEWCDVAEMVKVTYDRGFSEIPQSVKEVQKKIIRKILTHLRQDQNLANLEPDDVTNVTNERTILTSDLMSRINMITQAREKYTVL